MSAEGGAAAAGGAAPGGDPPTGENGEIVGGPRGPQQVAAQKRMQQTQAQVDEVVDIMRTNVEKVLERDQKLSELDDRADALQQGASQFEQQAGKLKRKMWWKNLKMMIIMGVIGIIVLIIIVGPYLPKGGENKTDNVVVNPNAQPINPTTNNMMNNANNAPHSLQSSWA
ncbi:neuronal synaptobrevin isoform X2 [Panulirus ornatus]|uniref:neuronal synaptobrevin isoform X1 n=1 Tax=Panulirus ornatus TaxID=150431 RepID=UPI003A89B78E